MVKDNKLSLQLVELIIHTVTEINMLSVLMSSHIRRIKADKILVYGTPTCDCVLVKASFCRENIEYDYIDISNDEEAIKKAIELNNGMRRIVIVFPDQTILVEPNRAELFPN